MIEYQKKIIPYLDGSMTPEEQAEFEAFVLTHPEFESKVREKQEEVRKLKDLMPPARLSPESAESLDSEIRQSLQHLLKEKPKNFWESVSDKFENWFGR